LNLINKKIGVVGYGSQAKRILEILKQKKLKPHCIYKAKKKNTDPKFVTDNSKFLEECNVIFICSPNDTHLDYIKRLYQDRYIYCEKPPVNKVSDIEEIKKINSKFLYFNFNYRFSLISQIISNRDKYKLGNILSGNFTWTQGLASKKNFSSSWRSDKKICPKGAFEILGSHILDLISFHFNIKEVVVKLSSFSKIGTAPDTAQFNIELENNSIISCLVSYFAPFIEKQMLVFENGYIISDEKSISVRGPRDVFDEKGFFKMPPALHIENLNQIDDFNQSITRSVEYFLDIVKNEKIFESKYLDKSLITNQILLK